MTDANKLADKLVEAGICKCLHSKFPPSGYVYTIPFSAEAECSAGELITDWRVAGKVLESMPSFEMWEVGDGHQVVFDKRFCNISESLPRAIIEAWYEALKDG